MIKLNDVSYRYKDGTHALNHIDFDVNAGNIIGLLGANGAGKTTLILSALGFLKPSSGQVLLEDKPLHYDKKFLMDLRSKVGIVFQNPDQQIFYSNVYDDIAFGPRNLKMPKEEVKQRVEWAMEMVDATDLKDKPVHFLSYGQKKRVAIAGALAMKHEVIFFDEPTAGLDPYVTEKIVSILKKISSEGIKIVLSCHDMDLIYKLCDYGYIIEGGNILKASPIESLFLDQGVLNQAHLTQPWLVKLHQSCNLPLFRDEADLINHLNASGVSNLSR